MAKKIQNDDTGTTPVEIQESSANETKVKAAPSNEISPFVDTILKSNKDYETLYVDSQGGIFTPNTPQRLVGNAILYKNPYHKQ